jgi:hypothetical protein
MRSVRISEASELPATGFVRTADARPKRKATRRPAKKRR